MDNPQLYNKTNSLPKTCVMQNLDEYMDIIKWKKDSLIIDIGCGDGSVTSSVAQKILPYFKTVTGCDINENMIQFANDNFSSDKVNFSILDIEGELPTNLRERYDLGISFFALNWCQHQKITFKNIYDLLKKDGSFFAIIVGQLSLYDAYRVLAKTEKWKSFLTDAEKYISPYHDGEDQLKQMQELLRKMGFTVTKLEYKSLSHSYENRHCLRDTIKSVVPFKIPDDLYDDFFKDLCLEIQIKDTEKYHFKKSINDFVINVMNIVLYIEK